VILPCPSSPQNSCVVLATSRLETKFFPNPAITDAALAAQYLVAENSPMNIDNLTDRRLLYSTANLQTMALCNCGTSTPVANVLQVVRVILGRAASPDDPAPTVLSSLDPPATNWLYSAYKTLPNALDVTLPGATLDNSTVTLGVPAGKQGTFQVEGPRAHRRGARVPGSQHRAAAPEAADARNYKFRLVGTPDTTSGGQAIVPGHLGLGQQPGRRDPKPTPVAVGRRTARGRLRWIELNIS
jgi:hypothetical protein